MGQSIIQVDAFTSRPFGGNPAAVCVLDGPRDERWMQQVASEMNLSETAFLHHEADSYRLRWFTPATEVDLCGHATLASAHVLWEEGRLAPHAEARFTTRSGLLTARRDGDWMWMNFPAIIVAPMEPSPALLSALGVQSPRFVGRASYTLVELPSEAAVRNVQPDFPALSAIDTAGVIVTAPSDNAEYDFVSRFFAPRLGVDEDPVTGSAHAYLAPYWAERLGVAGKRELVGYQASRRGGVVRVRMEASEGDRVWIGGQAVTTLRGALAV